MTQEQLAVEVPVLSIFSRIIGEIIERQSAAGHSAEVTVFSAHDATEFAALS